MRPRTAGYFSVETKCFPYLSSGLQWRSDWKANQTDCINQQRTFVEVLLLLGRLAATEMHRQEIRRNNRLRTNLQLAKLLEVGAHNNVVYVRRGLLHLGQQGVLLRSGRQHASIQEMRVEQYAQVRVAAESESADRREQEINSKDHFLIAQLTTLPLSNKLIKVFRIGIWYISSLSSYFIANFSPSSTISYSKCYPFNSIPQRYLP